MGLGESIRSIISKKIDQLGSTVTITPYTQATTDGGYSGQTETDGTPVEELAVPPSALKNILKNKMGDVEGGNLRIIFKPTVVIDISGTTKYKITWKDDVYDLIDMRDIPLQDIVLVKIATLGKRFD